MAELTIERFASIEDVDISQLLIEKNSANTQKATKVAWTVLSSYLKEKKLSVDFSLITAVELDCLLVKFYPELRKKDGSHYSKTSLRAIRAGIQRKIKESRPEMDIIADKDFYMSNDVLRHSALN